MSIMRAVATLEQGDDRVYVMYNKDTGATIECTKKFMMQWMARGFEVIEIKDESFKEELGKIVSEDI